MLPNQPLASTSTLIEPTALKTHRASDGPPKLVGPSSTITRFAATAPGSRLIVDVPVGLQWPFMSVGKRLRYVDALPATPVRFTTAAPAVPSAGIPAAPTVTTIDFPEPTATLPSHDERVSQTRTGVIGWKSPWSGFVGGGAKNPSTSTSTFTLPRPL